MNSDVDFETELRQRLRQAEDAGSTRPDLADSVISDGSRRRHRRGAATVAVGACAVVAVTSIGLLSHRHHPTSRDADRTPSVSQSSPQGVGAFSWMKALDAYRGPTDLTFLAGTRLTQPGGVTKLKNTSHVGLVGESKAGAVVNMVVGDLSDQYTSGFFLVAPDGQVSVLASSNIVTAQGNLLSPDGQQFTNGTQILDVTTGGEVGTIPRDAKYLIAWTGAGITYTTSGDRYRVWDPASHRITDLSRSPGTYLPGSSFGIRHAHGCSLVVDFGGPGTGPTTSYKTCEANLISVSPDGRYAVSDQLLMVDLASDQSIHLTDVDVTLPQGSSLQWTKRDELALSVPAEGNAPSQTEDPTGQSALASCRPEPDGCTLVTVLDVPSGQRTIDLGQQNS